MKILLALILSQPWLVCLIFVLMATFGFDALAAEIQAEAGQCRFDMSYGAFQGRALRPHNYGTPHCGLVSYRDSFRATAFGAQLGWSVGFFSSGATKSRDNLAVADELVGTPADTPANAAVFNATSTVRGILPTLTATKTWDRWSLTGEIGALFQDVHTQGTIRQQDQPNYPAKPPYDMRCHIEQFNHAPAIEAGILGGYRLSKDWNLVAGVRGFGPMNKGCPLSNFEPNPKHSWPNMVMGSAGVSYRF